MATDPLILAATAILSGSKQIEAADPVLAVGLELKRKAVGECLANFWAATEGVEDVDAGKNLREAMKSLDAHCGWLMEIRRKRDARASRHYDRNLSVDNSL